MLNRLKSGLIGLMVAGCVPGTGMSPNGANPMSSPTPQSAAATPVSSSSSGLAFEVGRTYTWFREGVTPQSGISQKVTAIQDGTRYLFETRAISGDQISSEPAKYALAFEKPMLRSSGITENRFQDEDLRGEETVITPAGTFLAKKYVRMDFNRKKQIGTDWLVFSGGFAIAVKVEDTTGVQLLNSVE